MLSFFQYVVCVVPCMHGGTCTNGSCVCPTGFVGEACHEPGM